ncbi:spermatogenesis-associated serine-rich protein 1 isoform X2 [Protopterus annectens]|uniref:spermatogenesis-associated serine-rich protein 1 isoform X2 n=1 Tax=Protopterus annectens TaxID=7888 RepID=UPI001CFB33D9|nr:spermatogenesis-associated serine-rich protein 1 isoform X2 [Protopterus annectens]
MNENKATDLHENGKEQNQALNALRWCIEDRKSRHCSRSFIPHEQGEERMFTSHIFKNELHFRNYDPEWKSSVRWLPEPTYPHAPFPDIKACKFPDEIRLARSFPYANRESDSEWTFYPDFGLPVTYHVGKKCNFNGKYLANQENVKEISLPQLLGRKQFVSEPRNRIPETSGGDKPYYNPEYSTGFHKMGSTRPVWSTESEDRHIYSIAAFASDPMHVILAETEAVSSRKREDGSETAR